MNIFNASKNSKFRKYLTNYINYACFTILTEFMKQLCRNINSYLL